MITGGKIKKSLLLVFLILQVNLSFAECIKSVNSDSLAESFFNKLYNFSFSEADSIIAIMNNSDMDRVSIANLEANLVWSKLLSGDEIEYNSRICDSCLHSALSSALKSKEHDLTNRMNIIYSYSLKARLENYNGNTLRSLVDFYKSISYIKELVNLPGEDEKLHLVLGLYYYFVDYIQTEYFMSGAIFLSFPGGDKVKGLDYLEKCTLSKVEMVRTEAAWFLFKIYAYIEKDYNLALIKCRNLTQQYPDNLVYRLEQYKLLLKMKKTEDARIYQELLIEVIQASKKVNASQKSHFMSQLNDISTVPSKSK